MSSKKEASKIGDFILDKSKVALFDAVTEAMHREPDGKEWAIAVSSFLMGACCAAHAIIDGIEEHNIIKRN
ncbi:MAG: hypothetical protein HKK66_08600 [Chlorobiaceae bacterium]|nr:hypothetical protein [Chlorobiaceae bacterium]